MSTTGAAKKIERALCGNLRDKLCGAFARNAAALLPALIASSAIAGGEQSVERIVVVAALSDRSGLADSASMGTVTKEQLAARTVYRPGELLESTPGLIVSQHSGEGKANQFYLRGFNLDHGTDLRTRVDGMLVNQRSHSHGQGWTDLNFIIPELADSLEYRKGTYFASEGDFSSAGSVHIRYRNRLDRGIADVGAGQHGYARALVADSPSVGNGQLLYALESMRNDGPFLNPDAFRKTNAVLRYSEGDNTNGFHLAAMIYRARWNATDQIPQRALINRVLQSRFDAIDASDGGESSRYSISGGWQHAGDGSATRVNAALVGSRLALFSNFTYFLDDPVNGDQFLQPDHRTTFSIDAQHHWEIFGVGQTSENSVGFEWQSDNIFNGLESTRARVTHAVTRRDHIVENSAALYAENATRWNPWLRTVAGLRTDFYRSQVASSLDANSGTSRASISNPKLALIFGPWKKTELFLNLGGGFHSNDARGTTIRVDPKTGESVDRVSPLVRSKGFELGVQTQLLPGWQSALTLYRLDFASELVFVGDAGTTEAGRASRRTGVEFANYYRLNKSLTFDADIAFARARFRSGDTAENHIPGAVEGVASAAVAVDHVGNYFGALQFRYFGPRPLTEDNRVRSKGTAQFNGRIGYRYSREVQVALEGFNLANRQASAIDYFYRSRLPGESSQGVDDQHFHPLEPRSFRLTFSLAFR